MAETLHPSRKWLHSLDPMATAITSTNPVNVIRHVVLYDGDCPMCTFQMKVLTWLDWLNAAQLIPLADPFAKSLVPWLTQEDLLEAVHCVTPEGTVYRGARCIRFIGMRMPLLVPLALVLWIPGVIWVAERIYQWVSRNRHLIGKVFGCKSACAIMPQRKTTVTESPKY